MTLFPASKFFYKGGTYHYGMFYTKREISDFLKGIINKNSVEFNIKDFNRQYKKALKETGEVTIFLGKKESPEFQIYSRVLKKYKDNRFYHSELSVEGLVDLIQTNEKDGGDKHVLVKNMRQHRGKDNTMFVVRNGKVHWRSIDLEKEDEKSLGNFFYSVKHPFLVFTAKETLKIQEELSPLFVLIYDELAPSAESLRDQYSAHAKLQKNNSNFALLEVSKLPKRFVDDFLQEFETEGEQPNWPLLVYFQPDFNNLKLRKNILQSELISEKEMKQFIKVCIEGDFQPFRKVDSRKNYSFAPYEALNADNWIERLENLSGDAVIILFQMPARFSRMKSMPKELANMLEGAAKYSSEPNLEIFLFNSRTNEINNFIPDVKKPSLMVYLQGSKASAAQIFQKEGISLKSVVELIEKRSQFDKRKFGGFEEGEMDFENLDLTKIMENLKNMGMDQFGDGQAGGANMDFGSAMEGMQEMMAQMGEMGAMFGDTQGMGGMGDMEL